MGRRPGALVAIGAVLLIVGAVIVFLVLRDERSTPSASHQVSVLVTTSNVAEGTDAAASAAAGAVAVRQVQASKVEPGALTDVDGLRGQVFDVAVPKGQQITGAVLRSDAQRPSTISVPAGEQAMAVSVPYTAGGAGYVRPGDHVSLYTLVDPAAPGAVGVTPTSRQLIANAVVLDVSTATNVPAVPTSTAPGVTAAPLPVTLTLLVALTPGQAEQVAFATTYDHLYVTILAKGETPAKTPGVAYGSNYPVQP